MGEGERGEGNAQECLDLRRGKVIFPVARITKEKKKKKGNKPLDGKRENLWEEKTATRKTRADKRISSCEMRGLNDERVPQSRVSIVS